MVKIKFGTDGWRGLIPLTVNKETTLAAAQGIAVYLKNNRKKKVIVGYDHRHLSKEIALEVSGVLASNDIKTFISGDPTPTPAVSSAIREFKLDFGIIITASHNPPRYNGIKLRTAQGIAINDKTAREIESLINKKPYKIVDSKMSKNLREFPILNSYLNNLAQAADIPKIRRAKLNIVVDSMFGAGRYHIKNTIKTKNIYTICGKPHPLFNERNPEPIEKNLEELKTIVKQRHADIGIATDGDADRVGIIDDQGQYVTPHKIASLLLLYIINKYKKYKNKKIIKTVSMGYLINKIAQAHGIGVLEVPIGFKHISPYLANKSALFGAEESGGYGFLWHLPERDGLASALMILEMLADSGKKLSVLIKEMEEKYSKSVYKRKDIKIENCLDINMAVVPEEINNIYIEDFTPIEYGIKLHLEDKSWVMIRKSGTESVVRVYAEADTAKKTSALIKAAEKIVKRSF